MAAPDIHTLATQLAILGAGRDPAWSTQTHAETPPGNANAGVFLQDATRTLIQLDIREDPSRRTVRITVTTLDLTATYTVTVDGNAVAYDAAAAGAADEEDVIQGIAAAINADATVNLIVAAAPVDTDSDGSDDEVVLTGLTEANYTVALSATGTGVLAGVGDRTSGDARIWWYPGAKVGSAQTSPRWSSPNAYFSVDYRGHVQRFETAGLARCFVQWDSTAYGGPSDGAGMSFRDPDTSIGPCLVEVETS